jgi:hypothetical protein
LKNQDTKLDAIYLTLPYVATRLNKKYPELPDEIKKLVTLIRIDQDLGALSKIYGALINEQEDNTVIISFDDDCIYKNTLVSVLMKHHYEHPSCAICGTGALIKNGLYFSSIKTNVSYLQQYESLFGFNVPNNGRYVDIIHGFVSSLYTRKFFPKKENLYNELFKYPLMNKHVFCNDDVLISGYLKKNNIKMMIFNDIPSIIADVKKEDALSFNFLEMLNHFDQAVLFLKEHGMFQTYEDTYICESPAVRLCLIATLLILLVIYIYVVVYKKYKF